MRLWFRRKKRNGDPQHPGRKQAKKTKGRPQGVRRRREPPAGDPIKNWETPEQAFLRQAGDPFIDG
jgi:hypothetical protein